MIEPSFKDTDNGLRLRQCTGSSVRCLLLMTTVAVAFGCGTGMPVSSLLPIKGTVTLDGKPASGVEVEFQSESGYRAHGTSDNEGAFTLQTQGLGTGIPADVYVVRARGPQIPNLYDETGAAIVEITTEQSPVQISLKSKVSPKDLPGFRTAAQ